MHTFFYLLPFFCLVIDALALALFHAPIIQTTLCFFSCALIYSSLSLVHVMLFINVLTVFWFIIWNNALIAGSYALILAAIAQAIRATFYPSRTQTVLITILGVAGQGLLQSHLLEYAHALAYTKKVLFVNIIIAVVLSLIYVQGRQGNRCQSRSNNRSDRGKSGLLTN